MSDQEPAVIVKNLHKTFKLPHEQHSGFKQLIINTLKRVRGYETQHVLDDISFEIKKGEFFGIVGRNGSGKSTLLKILAGIYVPNKGLVRVNGSLTPFIELGVGFNPELTGRENVYLNGALLGFSHSEIEGMYDSIVDFAELEPFMDQKLKNFSSGMQVRLAFSIAIRADTDILVLDEVLAVGDEAFQRKCNDYFSKIRKDKNKTVVLVTHSMEAVRKYCTKAILLEKGKITASGQPDKVADKYSMQFTNRIGRKSEPNRLGSGSVIYKNIKHKLTKDNLIIDFDIVNQMRVNQLGVIMGFDFYVDGNCVFGNDTGHLNKYKSGINLKGKEKRHYTVVFDNNFGSNTFDVSMTIASDFGREFTDRLRPAFSFDSINVGHYDGFKILAHPDIIEGKTE
jgi:ABC-type polysaccharide/polyol phosphate transport system ATPase subunit